MKNILFVIDSLACGGAEKSLISLLNNIDYKKYKVDLLLFKRGGEFEKFLPSKVNLIEVPEYFRALSGKYNGQVNNRIKYIVYRLKTSLNLRINNLRKKPIHSEQIVYKSIKNILYPLDKTYDVAIAYNQGMPTYFVSEKVKANKKLAWINCNYIKTKYDKDLDNKFYNNIDKIIVVSQFIYDAMSEMKYGYKEKMKIILDIVDPNLIIKMSLEEEAEELNKSNEFNILTVGRLATVKGYDLAIKAARLLKKEDYEFKWFVVGDGPQRKEIEEMIKKYDLVNEFILLGAKSNPYPYMKECDLYVQTSRKEGFGLTVMEAKILNKPIVCTNFSTAKELINDEIDGKLVDINENEIYKGIINYINDKRLYKYIISRLENNSKYSTITEINKLYEVIKE